MPSTNVPVQLRTGADAIGAPQVRASNLSAPLLEVASPPATQDAEVAAAGRAGGGRGGRARSVMRETSAPTETRWRVSNNRVVQRSFNGGVSWDVIPVNPPARILAGSAPTPSICWFTGSAGVILLTTDAARFVRIPFPEPAELTSVTATSATQAVVGTADGRFFRTSDGGMTWQITPRP
jgi:hypothetical protein